MTTERKSGLSRRNFLKTGGLLLVSALAQSACSSIKRQDIFWTPTPQRTVIPHPTQVPTATPEIIPTVEPEKFPYGNMLYYTEFPDSGYSENPRIISLWLAKPGTTEKRLITQRGAGEPVWSPSGDKFAVALKGEKADTEDSSLGIYDKNGDLLEEAKGNEHEIREASDIHWMPDGKSLIYSPTGCYDIFKYRLGSGKVEFMNGTTDHTVDNSLSLSPDGKTILYVHHTYGKYFGIHRIDQSRNNREDMLVEGETGFHDERFQFQWTPDGTKVLYALGGDKLFWLDVSNGSQREIKPDLEAYLDLLNLDLLYSYKPFIPPMQSVGSSVALSHNGDNIAFVETVRSKDETSLYDGRYQALIVADKEGKCQAMFRLPEHVAEVWDFQWLPEDKGFSLTSRGQMYIANHDGSDIRSFQLPKTGGNFGISFQPPQKQDNG